MLQYSPAWIKDPNCLLIGDASKSTKAETGAGGANLLSQLLGRLRLGGLRSKASPGKK
jgi:hypothetical protein